MLENDHDSLSWLRDAAPCPFGCMWAVTTAFSSLHMNIMLVRHGNIINTTGGEAKSDNREISSTIATIKILKTDSEVVS